MRTVFRFTENRILLISTEIALTREETSLLGLLLKRHGHIVSYETIYRNRWPLVADMPDDPKGTINSSLSKLRPKLEGSGLTITAHRDVGLEVTGEVEVEWGQKI